MEPQAPGSQNNIGSQNLNNQDLGPQISEPRRMNKPLLFILPILIAVAVGFGYFIFRDKPRPQITGLEVASKTASFLDKTLQPDGSMLGGYSCDSSTADKCLPMALSADQPHYGQAIFSYFLLAEATGDQSHRAKADKAINYVLDRCDTNVLMCEWNFFPLAQYYEKTGEDKYLTRGMLRPAEKFLTMPSYDAIIANVGHKLASLYIATQDERYKNRLVEIADAELEKPIENNNLAFQVIWSIYLPAYKISRDAKYLKASEAFFNNYNMAERIRLEEFKNPASIAYLIKAADGLLGLAELSESRKTYRAQAQAVLQAVLNKLWDAPQNPKFTGDYGFLDVDISVDEKIHKSTLFNGWLIKLFVLMSDEKFEEPIIK